MNEIFNFANVVDLKATQTTVELHLITCPPN